MVRKENDELKAYRSRIRTLPSLKDQQYDITCFNENINDIVIVEVKSENADKYTFGQILHYLLQEETFTCPWELDVNRVRGIILAKKIDSSLRELVKRYEKATPTID
jgi:RecB family endonuclease NucS